MHSSWLSQTSSAKELSYRFEQCVQCSMPACPHGYTAPFKPRSQSFRLSQSMSEAQLQAQSHSAHAVQQARARTSARGML